MLKSKLPPLCAALFSLACEREVSDTEQRVFAVECTDRACILTLEHRSPDTTAGDDANTEEAFIVHDKDRVLSVCPALQADFDCRPLTCTSSAVCSKLGGGGFRCENGLCQNSDRDLTHADRLALCLAETGLWKRSPNQIERLTLARACHPPCVLPAQCRQP